MELFSVAKAISAAQTSMVPFVVAAVFYYVFNYVVAFVINQIGNAFTGNMNVIGLILAIAVTGAFLWLLFRPYKEATRLTVNVKA